MYVLCMYTYVHTYVCTAFLNAKPTWNITMISYGDRNLFLKSKDHTGTPDPSMLPVIDLISISFQRKNNFDWISNSV